MGLWLDDPEQMVAKLHELEALAVATAVRLHLGSFGWVTAARFCELAMAAMLNLAGFEQTVATRLCEAW